jgi:hypothetical protein
LVENIFDASDKNRIDEYYKDYVIIKLKIAKE